MSALCLTLWLAGTAGAQEADEAEDDETAVEFRQYGYIDVGWFDAQGDGVAYARDAGHTVLGTHGRPHEGGARPVWKPEYADVPWVFFGDPWANPVNSQGDSADLGLDRTNLDRRDPIASGGRPSFLVNRYHHGFLLSRGALSAKASVNVEPRVGRLGRFGDIVALDLAYIGWRPFARHDLELYAGKVEPGFGREYRLRHAVSRFGITPSLIARYLYGPQTGVRVRGRVRRWFSYSLAVTNGSAVDERFGHFSDELDSNGVPTATARIGVLQRRPFRLEAGLSGQLGPQDGQRRADVLAFMIGADVRLDYGILGAELEALWARHPGGPDALESLDAIGGHLTVELRPRTGLGLLGRVDLRDAELLAWPNLYVTDTLRLTGGVRVQVAKELAVKLEYVHLEELYPLFPTERTGSRVGDADDLRNDVLAASVVYSFTSRPRPL